MLAYGQGKGKTLQFRSWSEPLPSHMTSVVAEPREPQAPTWSFLMDDSSTDSESESDTVGPASCSSRGSSSHGSIIRHRRAAEQPRGSFPVATLFEPHESSLIPSPNPSATPAPTRSRSGTGGLGPLAIWPAEHNSIAEPGKLISEPWASIFSFDAFNAVQSACFNAAACTSSNMVVSGESTGTVSTLRTDGSRLTTHAPLSYVLVRSSYRLWKNSHF